mmetsp:Transcript_10823/g.43622  ORF Transcript_10823/g.43622 Transcript_10823/m.43622 type:complete len:271 (+) Transcript_10823:202-1014(+)
MRMADARRGIHGPVSVHVRRSVPGRRAPLAPRAPRGAHPAAHGAREGAREADIDSTRTRTGRSRRAREKATKRRRRRSAGTRMERVRRRRRRRRPFVFVQHRRPVGRAQGPRGPWQGGGEAREGRRRRRAGAVPSADPPSGVLDRRSRRSRAHRPDAGFSHQAAPRGVLRPGAPLPGHETARGGAVRVHRPRGTRGPTGVRLVGRFARRAGSGDGDWRGGGGDGKEGRGRRRRAGGWRWDRVGRVRGARPRRRGDWRRRRRSRGDGRRHR